MGEPLSQHRGGQGVRRRGMRKLAYVDMRQLAYGSALVQKVWRRWKDTWCTILRGQAWQGFTGRVGVRLPGEDPAPRTWVGARDGEPAVFSREEQVEAQRRWKRDLDGAKVERGDSLRASGEGGDGG